MKIVALQAENLKRLVAVEIRPDGNMVEITGKNGQGKSSVLDAIWWALEGASHIQAQPIRKGATKALIKLDLGDIKVTRRFTAQEDGGYTTSITVENAEGASFKQPQTMLDALVGSLAFDPLAFTRMKAADQLETLKRFVPGVDFEAIEAEQKRDFEARTVINRRAKDLRAQAAAIALPDGAPLEPIDDAALVAELEGAGQTNAELEQRKARRASAVESCERDETEAARLRAEAKALIERACDCEDRAKATRDQLAKAPALPDPVDTGAVREKIAAARTHNETAAKFVQRAELEKAAAAEEAKSEALTKALAERDAAKAKAISAAKMPVDGIAFGADGVLLAGVPFEQASDAEQLRASIAIAAAMNPKLRVIRVRDGSLLDEDAMKLLAQFADAHDMQVWVERVDSSGAVGFVLEDGRVRNAALATEAA
mgnify:CR=1 FL=1